ncbi:monooxygenase [Pinisolibacter aquiterrae]|uniref:monooxygenase n=1 Tax=Pinisolibacter aquiterrae TaxID=2815579 RepID=UPI001C3DC9D8|nr:monooxygenase [Pinisolibacter aquiterrae]MBV5266906.1 monooxygenase [Pinisolibacter aquiterrae]MCC8234783.1 monooxygenase [Pinisolibacter aquiterrae]
MTTLLQFDFAFNGPWGADLERACHDLAADIAAQDGLIWKLWGENPDAGRAGGVYLFKTPEAADAYVAKHRPRLAAFGVTDPGVSRFTLNLPLSRATRAPL